MRKNRVYKIISSLLLIITVGCFLAGCGSQEETVFSSQVVFDLGKEQVYLDEVWIYAQTVIEGYEQKYGSQVWTIETEDSDGTIRTMEDITREDIIEDIRCTKILAGKAEEYQISLADTELEEAASQAADFYDNLTDAQITDMGITQSTVQQVFEENYLADKVYDAVLEEGGIEVSDEEARMTTIYDMYFACYREDGTGNIAEYTDEEKMQQKENAQEALTLLDDEENPSDYDSIVSKYGLLYGGSRTLSYADMVSEYGETLVAQLYAMENGTHTSVVETEYGYHIIAMVALTDSEATGENKQELLTARQKEYFEALYETWSDATDKNWNYSKDVNQTVYEKIVFLKADDE